MEDNVNQQRIGNNIENSKEFYTRKDIASVKVLYAKISLFLARVHLAFFKWEEDP